MTMINCHLTSLTQSLNVVCIYLIVNATMNLSRQESLGKHGLGNRKNPQKEQERSEWEQPWTVNQNQCPFAYARHHPPNAQIWSIQYVLKTCWTHESSSNGTSYDVRWTSERNTNKLPVDIRNWKTLELRALWRLRRCQFEWEKTISVANWW